MDFSFLFPWCGWWILNIRGEYRVEPFLMASNAIVALANNIRQPFADEESSNARY